MSQFLLLRFAGTPDEILVNMALVEVITVDRDGATVLHFHEDSLVTVSESLADIMELLGLSGLL